MQVLSGNHSWTAKAGPSWLFYTVGCYVRPALLLQVPPSNFIAGRPKAALLFWFFGDFRCGAL